MGIRCDFSTFSCTKFQNQSFDRAKKSTFRMSALEVSKPEKFISPYIQSCRIMGRWEPSFRESHFAFRFFNWASQLSQA